MSQNSKYQLLIVGGGIAGLSAALEAKKRGLNFLLLESSWKLGGCLETQKLADGAYFAELGPNSFSVGPRLKAIVQEVGLSLLVQNSRAKQKLIYINNKLVVANDPLQLLFRSQLISFQSKLKIFFKVFKKFSKIPSDRSAEDFIKLHFSEEVADNLLWPILSGIYAGNPANLSVQSVLPALWELEQKYGSLILGLLLQKNKSKTKRQICSFQDGLSELAVAIQQQLLSAQYQLNKTVTNIELTEDGYKLMFQDGEPVSGKKLLLAAPAYISAKLLPAHLEPLAQIKYAPIITATIWMPASKVNSSSCNLFERSFGFLSARFQETQLLGVIFSSALFPERAPKDMLACTCFMGGANNPQIMALNEQALSKIIEFEFLKLFGVSPQVKAVRRWHQAIPQFGLGHKDLIETVQKSLPTDIKLAGNYLKGVSLEDAANSGYKALTELF
jgi:protoporphyrinogen/coproporphyrinogen III oxidase